MIKSMLIALACFFSLGIARAEVINITKYGLQPNTKENAIPYFMKALEEAKNYSSTTIVFPKGRYDFLADIPAGYSMATYKCVIIRNLKNLTIDGQGAEFIMHGRTAPFIIDNCENITFTNFAIDWDRPMVTQGEFMTVTDNYVDLKIDKVQYPYEIDNGKVFYTGEGWRTDLCQDNEMFEKASGKIIPCTHDNSAGDYFKGKATEIVPGTIRFNGPFKWERKPHVSDIITMYHGIYVVCTFDFDRCKDVKMKNVTIYHGGSMGVKATFTENISIDKVDIIARKSKGRLFSNMADGFHIKGCKGLIKIENSEYNGGGDDYINVHNMYCLVNDVINKNTLEVLSLKGTFFAPGDKVWFVNHKTGQRAAMGKVKSVKLDKGNFYTGIIHIEFEGKLPEFIGEYDAIESAEWLAEVEVRNNKILKRHRATGIRATTPKRVVIENNYFNTAGTAILIEGDFQFWLESGAVENVKIQNNVFDDCLTSGSQFGGKWEWGEAVITITPSFRPTTETGLPYHRNIIITNNKFNFFDYPVLRARSVGNLQFTNNTLTRTYTYKPYAWIKSNFLLEGCRNVNILGNKFSNDFLGKNITTTFMLPSDLKLGDDQGLTVTRDDSKYIDKYINMKAEMEYKTKK
ncbi:MAG: right-handed parallel beta-helix repeat-containing protein [Bacteroidota bacterium]|nr:right-handed parallel beta-helix repeat-containing protein [Bacteroidota bacterium]